MCARNIRTIDLAALESNMRQIRSAVPAQAKIMAVVKADGYGHGAVQTAMSVLRSGADMLAVACVHEGTLLRRAGITAPILVLGAVTKQDVAEGVRSGLIQTVCSPEMVFLCDSEAKNLSMSADVHLKVDSGMGRIGIRTEQERDSVIDALNRCPRVCMTGAYTHFSDADGDEEGMVYSRDQFERFLKITEPMPKGILRHCCNSAAIHRFPEMSLDMVRAGISLYGYPPVQTKLQLKPCMRWTAEISYIKKAEAGSFISYGRTCRLDSPRRIATVTCGYGDGYHRAAGEKGYVLIRGKRAKIAGRICMDQMMVDVTEIPDAAVGDEAVLIGKSFSEQITAEDLAKWARTISYEILLSSGSRVIREYSETI